MSNAAWLFPGQGSQYVGMGRDLYEQIPAARAVFEQADEVLGANLSRLMFDGPEAELTDTINAQPAIVTHSIAALAALKERGAPIGEAACVAGHSLGEYSALVAAHALDFADAVKLVRARGAAMKRAGEQRPGAMAAILGLDDDTLVEICREAGAVQVANFNAPGQIVISGDKDALERARTLAKRAGAKRAIPLAVSIAAHSELMRPAVEEFRAAVEATTLRAPGIAVISNISAQPLRDADAIRAEMLAQLTSSVQWVKSIAYIISQGATQLIEVGPKDVLTGLNKRIAPSATARQVGELTTLNTFWQGALA